jgi:ATP phosphoribosyltransferase regulatory subunit
MSSLTKIPSGVQYFFDEEVQLRRRVEQQTMNVFAGWSYSEIILPMFDYHDLFARGMGAERAEKTYRFVDRDGALLALRPELTSLVARTVATRFIQRPRPIRLCYSGEVFRYDEPTERGTREFHQLGAEQIGQPEPTGDIEILLVVTEILTSLSITDFRISLSHVDFFNGVADALKLDPAKQTELRHLIDRRNSFALAEFLKSHAQELDEDRRAAFCQLTQVAGKDDAIEQARVILRNQRSRDAIEHLAQIYHTLSALGLAENFDIDFGDTGGQEYYTGLTFKVFVPNWGSEIGSGGRYDHLIRNFGADEPAVGFSFSLDALTGAITRRQLTEPSFSPGSTAEVVVDGDPITSFRHAREIRLQNKTVRLK